MKTPPSIDSDIRLANAEAEAQRSNCDIEIAQANQLQLDIDNDAGYATYLDNLPRLIMILREEDNYITEICERKSRTSGRHVIITLRKRWGSSQGRILLQACLGSDPVREILSYYRVLCCIDPPILLFKPRPVQPVSPVIVEVPFVS